MAIGSIPSINQPIQRAVPAQCQFKRKVIQTYTLSQKQQKLHKFLKSWKISYEVFYVSYMHVLHLISEPSACIIISLLYQFQIYTSGKPFCSCGSQAGYTYLIQCSKYLKKETYHNHVISSPRLKFQVGNEGWFQSHLFQCYCLLIKKTTFKWVWLKFADFKKTLYHPSSCQVTSRSWLQNLAILEFRNHPT